MRWFYTFSKQFCEKKAVLPDGKLFQTFHFSEKEDPKLLTSLLSNLVIVAPRLWRTFNFKTRSWRRMVNVTIHLSPSPSNTDSCGFISLRIMCIEELKLRVKVRPSATVRRAVRFKLFREPWGWNKTQLLCHFQHKHRSYTHWCRTHTLWQLCVCWGWL